MKTAKSTATPSVLFVCKKNGGKSQLAAALMRAAAADTITAYSAGTLPGSSLNAESVASLAELGIGVEGEYPKPVDPEVLAGVDLVVILGTEAKLEVPAGVAAETWETDEPSERGIEGMERMRLVRDDINARVTELIRRLLPES